MTTDTEALTYDHIVALALEHGFKLKPQVDGRMALNDYVIDFARAVYDIGHAAAKAAAAVAAGPENDMQYLVDEFEKSLPPMGHPLRKLGVRLTELLDEDQWAECERLLLEGWEHDAADRATGARWRANSSLEEWFPYTHEELARLRETLQGIADADWRRWEELATPDEFVRWAKSRAAHALRPNA